MSHRFIAINSLIFLSTMFLFQQCAIGSEKTFLLTDSTCHVIGGQAIFTKEKETFYTEIIGSTDSQVRTMCIEGFLGFNDCSPQKLYNFAAICHGADIVSAPQIYMGLFGKDAITINNKFHINGDLLSYVEPHQLSYGEHLPPSRRVALPPGFAPLSTLEGHIKTVAWDDTGAHVALSRSLSPDQRSKIKNLFTMDSGFVEPFPSRVLTEAIAIAEDDPFRHQSAGNSERPRKIAPEQQNEKAADGRLKLDSEQLMLLIITIVIGCGFVISSNEKESILTKIAASVIAAVISSSIVYFTGLNNEIVLLSAGVFGGVVVFSVSLSA